MKTIRHSLLFLLILLFVIPINSCSDDEVKSTDTTVAEDKENIELSLDGVIEMIQAVENGPAMESLELASKLITFVSDVYLKNGYGSTWYEIMYNSLGDVLDGTLIMDELDSDRRFNFDNWVGKYTYNKTSNTWTKTANDNMVFEFPSTETSTTNDLELTIADYEDILVTLPDVGMKNGIAANQFYYPTSFLVTIKLSGTKVVEIDLNNISYSTSGGYPTAIDASMFIAPTTFTFDYTASKPNDYKYDISFEMEDSNHSAGVMFSLLSGEELFTFLGTMLTLKDNPFVFLGQITTSMWIDDLKFEISLDAAEAINKILNSEIELSVAEVNSFFDAIVKYANAKVADLEFKDISGEPALCIVYKDGTYEVFADAFASFLTELGPYLEDLPEIGF